ncbi:MCE family protein [Prauserella flavalba]|uniref:Mammalian cell entry protein n=1 Tax=Prauserella flavalba TaxID=1477506 RepID=A0A318LZ05_9PSEU|nr:MCE family protein [Prauserella flavalba]PXY35515.1 mammalian cell entry protein [Prauserella flavalba]
MARETSRASLALRGLAVAVALVTGSVALVATGEGSSGGGTAVTAALPASAGPLREDSPVQFRGVTVGRLAAVDGDLRGASLSLDLDPALLGRVPANVQVRLLPRTLFGDQYIDLAVPEGAEPEGSLAAGAVLTADTSGRTVQLYDAYARLYELITALRPAELQAALTAVADTLRGRGAELGTMIDDAAELAGAARPVIDSLGEDLTTVAELSRDLSASAPDLMRSLDDAVALSRTVVAERRSLGEVLAAGIDLTAQSERMLVGNADRVIRLAHSTRPLTDVLGRHPTAVEEALDAAGFFLQGAERVFSTGRFKISAALTFDQPYPYTARDCPRYPGLDGPNCGDPVPARSGQRAPAPGGLAGPVGSPQEQRTVARLAPLLPEQTAENQPPGLLTLLLGPLLRGSRVVVP